MIRTIGGITSTSSVKKNRHTVNISYFYFFVPCFRKRLCKFMEDVGLDTQCNLFWTVCAVWNLRFILRYFAVMLDILEIFCGLCCPKLWESVDYFVVISYANKNILLKRSAFSQNCAANLNKTTIKPTCILKQLFLFYYLIRRRYVTAFVRLYLR